ncbi:MAG: winged helix-turn-helix domain-containing protein, partial [Bacteroidota bacterium]
NMSWKFFLIIVITSFFLFLSLFAAVNIESTAFENEKEKILIRKIGHEVLLHSGDKISRVLPIRQLSPNEYQIHFESQFTFQPDSIVNIIHPIVTANELASDYIVNVIACNTDEVIFGYAILGTEQDNIVPCSGREQPKSCYYINLKFAPKTNHSIYKRYIYVGIALLVLLSFIGLKSFLKSDKPKTHITISPTSTLDALKIGNYLFHAEDQCLIINTERIALTSKEAKLLYIFATQPNKVIERAYLQKEVWENEGVIVGRSLDMFISKLRKKLKKDTSIKIMNLHGKGYKLEIVKKN